MTRPFHDDRPESRAYRALSDSTRDALASLRRDRIGSPTHEGASERYRALESVRRRWWARELRRCGQVEGTYARREE